MKRIFIDPSYQAYENNKLFDANDVVLNRDDTLAPYIKFKTDMALQSVEVLTYDLAKTFKKEETAGDGYISFGNLRDKGELKNSGLKLMAFFLMEPPLVAPKMYEVLPYLSNHFEQVFVHNTKGDCYSLEGVNTAALSKLYWPQPYGDVVDKFWSVKSRDKKIVVINGNHRPRRLLDKELYSQRIKWALGLKKFMGVDLFGRGWDKVVSRASLWRVFLLNYFKIQDIYRGSCGSKLEVMSHYDFVLCFENLIMDGYITEKIFDCFYSGAIPVYRGGDDINLRIPSGCYIDLRKFKNAKELSDYLLKLSGEEKENYRQEAKKFLLSPEGQKYFKLADSLRISRE